MLVKTLILAKLPGRGECVATCGEKTCTTPIWARNSKVGVISFILNKNHSVLLTLHPLRLSPYLSIAPLYQFCSFHFFLARHPYLTPLSVSPTWVLEKSG